ncbi:hypothetical protein HJD18_09530 [Thermoleophilia bacterium SCSIO 60948]|nr:hypothetical protein HJD18_09530 [Thermoleophilia bacterium SCSIO 60948]
MKRFLLLYAGPAPIGATHEGWPEWLERAGAALVDSGSPMRDGCVVRADGSVAEDAGRLHGYGIIEAADRDAAVELVRDHPLWRSGSEYTIELFEVPRR